MKTIAVFGGSGKSGQPFIRKALEQGYSIKALLRSPDKLSIEHEKIEKTKGDILSQADIERTIQDVDAVINLSGHVKNSPADLQVVSVGYIIEAMKKQGIRRLVQLSGGGVRDIENDTPKFIDNFIVFLMKNMSGKTTRNVLIDGIHMANMIKESGLDWTIVRAPMLNNDPAKGSVQVGYVGQLKGIKLTREDLADFILQVLEENSHIQDMPFVVN